MALVYASMLGFMYPMIDAFWRALAYFLHPKLVLLSLLPLALMLALIGGLGYFYGNTTLEFLRAFLEDTGYMATAWQWLDDLGAGQLKIVMVPLIVICIATPLIVALTLLAVSLCMMPAVVNRVARRRFVGLERLQGASFAASVAWSLISCVMALVAMVVSMPLWLVPPLIVVLPPLIWGWLTYRVMAFDALAVHASVHERRTLFKRHRLEFIVMGVVAGYLCAVPSMMWTVGIKMIFVAPILASISYTLIFTFTCLWFAHFCLAALERLRSEKGAVELEL